MTPETKTLMRRCLPFFAMLGDENRQEIIALLSQHERLSVNALTELVHLSRPAVSHHLKLLLQAQMVKVEQVANERFYAMNYDHEDDCPIVLFNKLAAAFEHEVAQKTTQQEQTS